VAGEDNAKFAHIATPQSSYHAQGYWRVERSRPR